METVFELAADLWDEPFSPDLQTAAMAALEAGKVVCLPRLAFAVEPPETPFLRADALDDSRKNISFDPKTGKCQGTGFSGDELTLLTGMLQRYGRLVEGLVRGLFPRYADRLERARTSFRPAEISGREYSPRHDDKRLHVDAFPTRPMRGRRILRVFNNIAPDGVQRQWLVGEPFADFAGAFAGRVRPPLPGQFLAMDLLGLTKGRRTPYDHIMLGLHDAAKLDVAYQANAPRDAVAFAPGTTWMCFTDAVLHAALSGRCALEQTFHIPVEAMFEEKQSPLRILEKITGRALV